MITYHKHEALIFLACCERQSSHEILLFLLLISVFFFFQVKKQNCDFLSGTGRTLESQEQWTQGAYDKTGMKWIYSFNSMSK